MKKQMGVLALATILFSSGAFATEYNGAIYVDQATGIAGTAVNYATIEEAKAAALATCKKKSGKKSCTAIQLWANGCAAAAWSPTKKSARSEMAETNVKLAESKARARCKELEKDSNCEVVASACTNWETIETTTTTTWW